MKRTSLAYFLGFLVIFAALPGRAADRVEANASSPVISFDGQTVNVTAVSPGSEVLLFALGLVPSGWDSELVRWRQVVSDDDRNGAISFDAGRAVPCKSIWIAAELRNGHYAVSSGPGCPLQKAELPRGKFKRGAKGELELFLHSRPYVDMLYLEPGNGAWTLEAVDGHPESDGDGVGDGTITLNVTAAKPVAADRGPAGGFRPGGILVAIDLYSLDVVAERLDGQMLGEVLP